jgi:hypothetical protein
MKTALVAAMFAVASFPLLGQTSPGSQPNQPTNPATQQTTPPGAEPAAPAAAPETSAPSQPAATSSELTATSQPAAPAQPTAAQMRPVNAKLVGKLDSSTAKTGDSVAVETRGSVKTADGTEIPKGSKLTGHVVAVQPSGGQTSQVVLQFDQAQLKGGQTLPIHAEIESVSPAGGSVASSSSSMDAEAMPGGGAAPGGGSSSMSSANSSAGSSQHVPAAGASPAYGPSAAAGSAPQPGTIVNRNGNIAIRTTSIPGVLLANNAPGQQDPRMARASGILLGAKQDVKLDGGTEMVLDVASTGGAQ